MQKITHILFLLLLIAVGCVSTFVSTKAADVSGRTIEIIYPNDESVEKVIITITYHYYDETYDYTINFLCDGSIHSNMVCVNPPINRGNDYYRFLRWEYSVNNERVPVTDDTVFTENTDLYPVGENLYDSTYSMVLQSIEKKWEESERLRRACNDISNKRPRLSLSKKKGRSVQVKMGVKNNYIDGYEVQYSTAKNLKKAKRLDIQSSSSSTKCSVKNIKKNKKYYFRVRAYVKYPTSTTSEDQEDSVQVYHSRWSKIKSIKLNK